MRAVDTNVLVRLLVQDDRKQVATAMAFVEPGAWISLVVLVEAVWVLGSVYGTAPGEIAKAIELLLDHKDIAIQDEETVKVALALFLAHAHVGFSDCLVLAVAQKAGHGSLGTFDRDLARLAGTQRLK
jgi:predicted nucleic-acid-binding protein